MCRTSTSADDGTPVRHSIRPSMSADFSQPTNGRCQSSWNFHQQGSRQPAAKSRGGGSGSAAAGSGAALAVWKPGVVGAPWPTVVTTVMQVIQTSGGRPQLENVATTAQTSSRRPRDVHATESVPQPANEPVYLSDSWQWQESAAGEGPLSQRMTHDSDDGHWGRGGDSGGWLVGTQKLFVDPEPPRRPGRRLFDSSHDGHWRHDRDCGIQKVFNNPEPPRQPDRLLFDSEWRVIDNKEE